MPLLTSPPLPASARISPAARLKSVLWLAAAPAFLLCLYSRSFRIWFREDDFPLLGFVRDVHSMRDFWRLMFAPYAQGTIRPLSERLPFFLSWNFFGENCVPLRALVFLTAVADLILIAILVRRLCGSRLAAASAGLFWAASAALIVPMTWNSAYNEIQYPTFLLAALLLFIRYSDTGRPRYWWWQLAVFIAGFGSLENNVVYPAVAVSWALFAAGRANRRRLLRSTIPLFAISAVYSFLHLRLAPAPASGLYAIHVDSRIARTFAEYWHWAFVAPEWTDFGLPQRAATVILVLTMASLLLFLAWQSARGARRLLFYPAWFLVTLSPLLLLPDRHTEYYLCAPAIGLAMLAGEAVALAWQRKWIWRTAMLLPVLAWFSGSIPAVRGAENFFVARSKISKELVLGAVEAHRLHPGKTILLESVSQEAWDTSINENGFRAFGLQNVYLTPGARKAIHPDAAEAAFDGMVVDPSVAAHALEAGDAVVFDFSAGHLKNITAAYAAFAAAHFIERAPSRVQIANPLYAYLLGPEWSAPDRFVRWMPARATLTLAAPVSTGERIAIAGFCWEEQLRRGPVHLSLEADGIPLGTEEITGPDIRFEKSFPAPDSRIGNQSMRITLTASPVAHAGTRDLGVMVESVALSER